MTARHLPSLNTTQSKTGPASAYCSAASLRVSSRASRSFFSRFLSSLGDLLAASHWAMLCCAFATAAFWLSMNFSLRSALTRFVSPVGKSSNPLLMPRRTSFRPSAHVPSLRVRPVSPVIVVASLSSLTSLMSTSPPPVQSTTSMIFRLPSEVTCSPAAPGSTPVSKIATLIPRPSHAAFLAMKAAAPVSCLGRMPSVGNFNVPSSSPDPTSS
mmetsp:Transcript_4329/g.8732  ORF Transcript_4329/g.8732 Transcript_4329/m.8732 type:complete len:213 (+) Transcript_4329:294-932(+)